MLDIIKENENMFIGKIEFLDIVIYDIAEKGTNKILHSNFISKTRAIAKFEELELEQSQIDDARE